MRRLLILTILTTFFLQEKCSFEGDSALAVLRHFGLHHHGIDKYMDQLIAPLEEEANDSEKKKPSATDPKELWVVKRAKAKPEAWVVNASSSKTDSGDEVESDAAEDDAASVASTNSSDSKPGRRGRKGNGPHSMEDFSKALKDNLRTKDGKFCTAKDESTVVCVCGKEVKICSKFYWKYLVQKPRVVNGKLYARGHWYICDEVKRRGSEYQLSEEEKLEIKKELENSRKGTAEKKYINVSSLTEISVLGGLKTYSQKSSWFNC